jgi:hypothetical protein
MTLILLFIWSTHKALESTFARADFLEPFRDGRVLGLDVNGKLRDKFHPANEAQIRNGVFPSSKISLILRFGEMCLQYAENTFDFIHISIDGGRDFLLVIERKPTDSAFEFLLRWVPESLADVWAESRDLEEQPFEDVGLFVVIFRPEFIFRVVMFDEIQENGARFPNNKIVSFVINNCRNPSIGVDFRVFSIVSAYKLRRSTCAFMLPSHEIQKVTFIVQSQFFECMGDFPSIWTVVMGVKSEIFIFSLGGELVG